MPYTLIQKHLQ
ncbi:cc90fe28-d76d-4cc9-afdb-ebd87d40b859 [Thermothielavioides terrestris]|uniref:Cc90fe28-d76d-4cc9-afdb-ebd87d40b859 n=1 Tax=Thermothielavioides terrestris TaxID=2587410 RepID=A0A3S5CWU0_9PEZI|nr:cc90fe28-d76d-4cc9-afdb-ebd87d40b859 [Thermothielavioides terrestris]